MRVKFTGKTDDRLTNGRIYEVSHFVGRYVRGEGWIEVVDGGGSLSLLFDEEYTLDLDTNERLL